MFETRSATFNVTDLPEWAQKIPAVVRRCRANYEYRCSVCVAQSHQVREVLIREAFAAENAD